MTAIAAISHTAEIPLVMRSSEPSAVTTDEMTSRMRATLERRSTKMPSTIEITAQMSRISMKATITPTTESGSMLACSNSGTRPISSTMESRATTKSRAPMAKSAALRPDRTIVIQPAAVTVPGRESPPDVATGPP